MMYINKCKMLITVSHFQIFSFSYAPIRKYRPPSFLRYIIICTNLNYKNDVLHIIGRTSLCGYGILAFQRNIFRRMIPLKFSC